MILIPVAVAFCAGLVFRLSDASAPAGGSSCQVKMTAFPIDPGSECCTRVSANRSVPLAGGKGEVHIYQNPWAALIDYDTKIDINKRLCSGTLISGRYVLTAAQCVTGLVLNIVTPTKVRLGDYDCNHEGPDCVPVEGAGEICTEGAISIEIETIIPHPNYNFIKKTHDIALIRLKEAAPYTDFIRPICLPTTNPETNPPDHSLYAVSWYKDNVKVLFETPFVNQEKCKLIYGRNIDLGQGQLCAGGLEGKDTCRGDSGGPLVYENKEGVAELTGIVSFGPAPCGQKDIPSVYTNIFEYLDWIKTII